MVAPSKFLNPEFATLVEATRWLRTSDHEGRLASLASKVENWDLFLQLVDRHRVAGLCYAAIANERIPLPETFKDKLGRRAMSDARHELALLRETLCLIRQLNDEGIGCRILKGAAFAQMYFGRFGVRYSTDIDLLVSPSDVVAAESLLRRMGYLRTDPPETADWRLSADRLDRYKDYGFTHRDTGIVVELHWRLFANRHVFPRAEDRPPSSVEILGGTSLPTLDLPSSDLYLCFHGAEHAWSRLKWLADLGAAMGARSEMAYRTYERARHMGRHRLVGPGLYLCHVFYGYLIPDRLVEDIGCDRRMRFQIATALASLVGDGDGTELEQRPLATTRKNLSHYLLVNDPRHLLAELQYDLMHRERAGVGQDLKHRVGQVWRMLSAGSANV